MRLRWLRLGLMVAAGAAAALAADTCQGPRDPCHAPGTPPNTSSCCACTPWPHCSPGRGQNFVCNGAPDDPASRCVAGPPPPPWGTPCPAPPPTPTMRVGRPTSGRTVMLWIGNPFGWPKGGPPNQVEMCTVLAELEKLRDVVDVITVSTYYLADPVTGNMSQGGLLRSEGTTEVVGALRQAGWKNVQVMVGDIPAQYGGTNGSIDVFRHYTASDAFAEACVEEVATQGYQGINLDFEPDDCLKQPAVPCGPRDCAAMGGLLSKLKALLAQRGLPSVEVSVDTGQSGLAGTGCLNTSLADRFISMNSYYDREGFDISLPRDIAAVGVERYGLGVCPTCSTAQCQKPKCKPHRHSWH